MKSTDRRYGIMAIKDLFRFGTVLLFLCNVPRALGQVPEQIHLSYGVDPSRMVVTWSTPIFTMDSICYYKPIGKDPTKALRATGFTSKFSKGHTQFIHRVTLDRLKPGTRYLYMCGDDRLMSDVYSFKSMQEGTDWVPRIAFYGDLGVVNDRALGMLQQDVDRGMYDTILHIGDFAYNMENNAGYLGDTFMKFIQPIASGVPYMTAPGNHEMAFNFSNYKNRFTMPTDELSEKLFYSFDIGPAHIISFSTEFYFFFQYGFKEMQVQFDWLTKDLKEANRNRHIRPWIITMAHRPMYCSNRDHDDCTFTGSVIRNGLQFLFGTEFFGLEKLFFDQGVDLALWAHEHSYERLWPIYNEEMRNGSLKEPYTNPGAPVHLITGSAGCYGKHDPFHNKSQVASWSAFRTTDYGYSRMTIHNASHMHLQQVSIDQGKVVDDFWLIKDKHQPYKDLSPTKERKPVQYKDFLKIKDAYKFDDPVKFNDPLKMKDPLKAKNPLKFKGDFQYKDVQSRKYIRL